MPLTVVETTRTTDKSIKQASSAPVHRATPVVVASSSHNKSKQAPATNVWQPKSVNNNPTTKKQQIQSNKTGKPPGGVWSAQPKPNPKRSVPPAANQKLSKLTPLSSAAQVSPADSTTTAVAAATNTSQVAAVVVAPPRQGKPNVICGCFGNVHKPLANCLYCGRISCEREGYSYCAFCGNLVEPANGTRYVRAACRNVSRFLSPVADTILQNAATRMMKLGSTRSVCCVTIESRPSEPSSLTTRPTITAVRRG
jgi:hypothetical protein